MIVILYASTGGATRAVAEEFGRLLPKAVTMDIRTCNTGDARYLAADLVLAGSPTYGRGDWHHAWGSHFDAVLPVLASARRLALFGLGDTRFHSETFCGALGRLHDAVDDAGLRPIGMSPADCYNYRSTPSLRGTAFPGFVFDHRQDRRSLGDRITRWLLQLSPQCGYTDILADKSAS